MPLCPYLERECTSACMAYTCIATMDAPGSVKIICLRLIREHGCMSVAQDKAVEDDVVGELTPPPVHSPEMYR